MKVQMNPRLLYIPVLHIDTNLINARQKLPAINQLEKWFEDQVILINMSSTAQGEALGGGNCIRTRKANQQLYTATKATETSDPLYLKVEAAIFPAGAWNDSQRNDVKIICEAAKYGAILVTRDGASKTQPGGLLGNRGKLRDLVQVLSPDEAVAFVRGKMKGRDEFNRQVAKEFDIELPPWTGMD